MRSNAHGRGQKDAVRSGPAHGCAGGARAAGQSRDSRGPEHARGGTGRDGTGRDGTGRGGRPLVSAVPRRRAAERGSGRSRPPLGSAVGRAPREREGLRGAAERRPSGPLRGSARVFGRPGERSEARRAGSARLSGFVNNVLTSCGPLNSRSRPPDCGISADKKFISLSGSCFPFSIINIINISYQ